MRPIIIKAASAFAIGLILAVLGSIGLTLKPDAELTLETFAWLAVLMTFIVWIQPDWRSR